MRRDTDDDHDHRQDHGPAGEASHGDKPSMDSPANGTSATMSIGI